MKFSKLLVFLIFVSTTYAQNPWSLKAGLNFSKFRDNDSDLMTNFTFGIAKEFYISNKFIISPQLLITRQGSIVRNKPVWNGDWEWYLDSYDIEAKHTYVEIPLLFGYNTSIVGFTTQFYIGPSFRMVLFDHTELTNRKIIYDDNPDRREDYKNYDFEFVLGDYERWLPFKEPGFNINVGFSTIFKSLSVEMRYAYSLNRMGQIGQLAPIDRYLHTIHFLLGYYL